MARGETFRVCPKCGSRNKAGWEFCVRCGEALSDVTIASAKPTPPSVRVDAEGPQEGSPALVVVGLVLLVVALAGSAWWIRSGTAAPATPPPGLFAFPLPAPSQAAPREEKAAPSLPGADFFNDGLDKAAKGDLAGALKSFAQAVAENATEPRFREAYGEALCRTGNSKDCISQFQEAVRLSPGHTGYRATLAVTLEHFGRADEAIEQYTQALAVDPTSADAERNLGVALLQDKDNAREALPHLKKACDSLPGDMVCMQQLAYALEKTGDDAGAAASYRKVVEAAPDAPDARGRLAELLFKQGKADDAIALTRVGIERAPNQPMLHRDLAALLEKAGRPREASAAYREYVRLAPNATDAKEISDRADALDK